MHVMALGVPVFDQLLVLEELPKSNRNARVLEASWQYGGKVATAIAAVARLGFQGAMVGCVGGVFGALIRADFERHGVDCSNLIDVPGAQSSYVVCLAEKSTGGRSFLGVPQQHPVKMISADQLDRAFIISADWLLVSGMDEASLTAAKWYNELNKPVVIDADHYADSIQENLGCIDHFVGSEFYYQHLYGDDLNYEPNLRAIRARQGKPHAVTIITLGERGLVGIDEAGAYFEMPAFAVDVVDTTGAGDTFHGAYIAGRLMGLDTRETCRFASAVSAIQCTYLGGRAGIPTREQTEAFLRDGTTDFPELRARAAFYARPPFGL